MKTIFAKSVPGRSAFCIESDAPKAADMLPAGLLRKEEPRLPQCSELDVVRHFTGLSKLNYCVDGNFYPLGSCTMKYNPKFAEVAAALPGFTRLHPVLPQLKGAGRLCQGALYLEAVTLEDYERGTIDEDLTDARQHRHRAGMVDIFPWRFLAIRQAYRVAVHLEEATLQNLLRAQRIFSECHAMPFVDAMPAPYASASQS